MVHSIWVGIVGEGAADLDGPDLALHAGGVEVGVGEFLEVAQAHVSGLGYNQCANEVE